jgi:hypothetical protein
MPGGLLAELADNQSIREKRGEPSMRQRLKRTVGAAPRFDCGATRFSVSSDEPMSEIKGRLIDGLEHDHDDT